MAPALGVLVWLRWPRWRWGYVVLMLLAVTAFSSTIFDFAGGDAEWHESGGSRMVLIERVIEVTMRNPITGLGPAVYRSYARMTPLPYQGAYWLIPRLIRTTIMWTCLLMVDCWVWCFLPGFQSR